MASTIAKAVVGSKVKEVTKEIEGAVGLDEKQNKAQVEAETQRELMRKKEKRKVEKRELHKQKESERKNIREKYQLPKNATKADDKSSSEHRQERSTQGGPTTENKCSLC